MADITKLPNRDVIMDLDDLERPAEDVRPPFVVTVGGEQITFEDPAEIEWTVLARVNVPGDILHAVISRQDRETLSRAKLPLWKFERLMKAFYDHYDLDSKIDEAKRRQSLGV